MQPMTNATHQMDQEEWNEISASLSSHHALFYRFWSVCVPSFCDSINTAAVFFDKGGNCIDFKINYEFWQGLSFKHKLFVISHECIHLIYNHGKRASVLFDSGKYHRKRLNIAMDIATNHALIRRFDFDRDEIDPDRNYIWLDKLNAKLGMTLDDSRCFEYYYAKLVEVDDAGMEDDFGSTVDDHNASGDSGENDDAMRRLMEELGPQEQDTLEKMWQEQVNRHAMDMPGLPVVGPEGGPSGGIGYKLGNFKSEKVSKKKKWETVIKRWTDFIIKHDDIETEQWLRKSRRFALMGNGIKLPYSLEAEELGRTKDRVKLYFFLDTSGSCSHLAKRFFRAAKSLPKERFDIRLYCFDDAVYPTTLESGEVFGGNGTRFDIIEKEILKDSKDRYPSAVFVITDGWGNAVKPKNPKAWHWFLSTDYRTHIPKESSVHLLKDYE